jgi:hypothetical protein
VEARSVHDEAQSAKFLILSRRSVSGRRAHAVLWCSGQASRPLEPLTEVRILPGLSGFLRFETSERLFVMLTRLILGESAPIEGRVGKTSAS